MAHGRWPPSWPVNSIGDASKEIEKFFNVSEEDLQMDSVNHPPHYTQHPSGVECIDVIEHMPHNIGAAIKYLWRCDAKHPDPIEDLRKAEWYIRREIERRRRMAADDQA